MTMNERACATDTGLTEKTMLQRICRDATYLHAMCEGVDALYDRVETDPSPASNAMPAMLESLIHRAERLLQDIEALDLMRHFADAERGIAA